MARRRQWVRIPPAPPSHPLIHHPSGLHLLHPTGGRAGGRDDSWRPPPDPSGVVAQWESIRLASGRLRVRPPPTPPYLRVAFFSSYKENGSYRPPLRADVRRAAGAMTWVSSKGKTSVFQTEHAGSTPATHSARRGRPRGPPRAPGPAECARTRPRSARARGAVAQRESTRFAPGGWGSTPPVSIERDSFFSRS